MAGLKLATDLLIDRHHRGALVLVDRRTFALCEAAVALLERARGRPGYQATDEHERSLAAELVAMGVLVEDEA